MCYNKYRKEIRKKELKMKELLIKEVLKQKEYSFVNENELLGENIMFLTFGGSHAYGTNIETSDVDIRGCTLNRKSDLIGLSSFEQVIDNKTDTTIYAFNKFVKLITDCNPNTIELLGCKKEHYIYVSELGQMLFDNKWLFLSKKALHSFGGYANQQLRRLQNALARDSYPQREKEIHILNSIKASMNTFNESYKEFDEGSIKLKIGNSLSSELEQEILLDINLKDYPLRDYKNIWSAMNNVVKEYGKLNGRNHKKDDLHLNKHAMHLVRLYLMCLDILEKQEINTHREKDLPLLMDIRNGKYQKADGTYYIEFFDIINEFEKRLDYAKDNTSLPEKPDYKKIEELVMYINERIIKDER